MLPAKVRAWMKSKLFGAYVHSSLASSISNCTFGGTLQSKQRDIPITSPRSEVCTYHVGWIALRSVPITWADGYSSPTTQLHHTSVSKLNGLFSRGEALYTFNSPNTRPSSDIQNALGVVELRDAQIPSQRQPEDVVRHVQAILFDFVVGQ